MIFQCGSYEEWFQLQRQTVAAQHGFFFLRRLLRTLNGYRLPQRQLLLSPIFGRAGFFLLFSPRTLLVQKLRSKPLNILPRRSPTVTNVPPAPLLGILLLFSLLISTPSKQASFRAMPPKKRAAADAHLSDRNSRAARREQRAYDGAALPDAGEAPRGDASAGNSARRFRVPPAAALHVLVRYLAACLFRFKALPVPNPASNEYESVASFVFPDYWSKASCRARPRPQWIADLALAASYLAYSTYDEMVAAFEGCLVDLSDMFTAHVKFDFSFLDAASPVPEDQRLEEQPLLRRPAPRAHAIEQDCASNDSQYSQNSVYEDEHPKCKACGKVFECINARGGRNSSCSSACKNGHAAPPPGPAPRAPRATEPRSNQYKEFKQCTRQSIALHRIFSYELEQSKSSKFVQPQKLSKPQEPMHSLSVHLMSDMREIIKQDADCGVDPEDFVKVLNISWTSATAQISLSGLARQAGLTEVAEVTAAQVKFIEKFVETCRTINRNPKHDPQVPTISTMVATAVRAASNHIDQEKRAAKKSAPPPSFPPAPAGGFRPQRNSMPYMTAPGFGAPAGASHQSPAPPPPLLGSHGAASNASSASAAPTATSQYVTQTGQRYPPGHVLAGVRFAGPGGCNACGKLPSDHRAINCTADQPTRDNWQNNGVRAQ